MLEGLLAAPTRFMFFTGKGGVGKTSLSSATAIALAEKGHRVLLVSTDPASNLSEVLATPIGRTASPVSDVSGLDALDIDPDAAAAAYRDRVVGPIRGVLPDSIVSGIEEQLSGACTVEIAAFDEFTALLADPAATANYDHVIFDTAPTGHTLRLLALPAAWTGFLDTSTVGATCIGPLSGLTQAQDRYRVALEALADPTITTLVLVTRPDRAAINEADRARAELEILGLTNQYLLINGVFRAQNAQDPTARSLEACHREALQALPASLSGLRCETLPLLTGAPIGANALRDLLQGRSPNGVAVDEFDAAYTTLADIADDIATRGQGLVMTMGKGGVGKTTIAAALAVNLARRGLPVTLSTTDPAAHLQEALGERWDWPAGLLVERVDPDAATAAYIADVLATAGADLDIASRTLLEEDLRSPCTGSRLLSSRLSPPPWQVRPTESSFSTPHPRVIPCCYSTQPRVTAARSTAYKTKCQVMSRNSSVGCETRSSLQSCWSPFQSRLPSTRRWPFRRISGAPEFAPQLGLSTRVFRSPARTTQYWPPAPLMRLDGLERCSATILMSHLFPGSRRRLPGQTRSRPS